LEVIIFFLAVYGLMSLIEDVGEVMNSVGELRRDR
jgi:hypothetical protein